MKYAEPEEWDTTPHIGNFLKAVRSRNQKDLTCDIEDGHLSAALVPHGQHQLSHRPQAALRSEGRALRERRRGQQLYQAEVSRAVRVPENV